MRLFAAKILNYLFYTFEMESSIGMDPTSRIYTSLFKACSLAKDKEEGLARARRLRQKMIEKEIIPQFRTHRAMIKVSTPFYYLCFKQTS